MKTILAGALLCSTLVAAQEIPSRKQMVTLLTPETATVARGRPGSVELIFRVQPGYHVNSNQPKQEYLKKTELKLDPPTDIVVTRILYPKGEDLSFPFAPDEKLSVYGGDFDVKVGVRPLKTVLPAKYAFHGTLKYQACDKAACYPPRQLPVVFDIKVVKGGGKKRRVTPQSPHIH